MSVNIYHITTKDDWQKAQGSGFYYHPNFKQEGFIHCSTAEQVTGVLQRYYLCQSNLVKLVIDVDKLVYSFKYEWAPSIGQMFPHIYGPINIEAILEVIVL